MVNGDDSDSSTSTIVASLPPRPESIESCPPITTPIQAQSSSVSQPQTTQPQPPTIQ